MDFPRVADAGGDIGLDPGTHEFIDGVPPGTPASVGRAEDMNQVFRELRAVIAWGGGNPDETIFTQVRDALINGINALLDANGANCIINGGCVVGQLTGGRPQANLSTSYQYAGADMFAGKGAGTLVTAGTIQQESQALVGASGYSFSLLGVTITGAGQVMARYRAESIDAKKYKNIAAMMIVLKVYQDTGAVGSGSINYTITLNKPNAADNYSASTNIATSGNIAVNNSAAQTISYQFAPGDCSNGLEVIVTAACGAVVTKNFRFTEWDLYPGTRVRSFLQGRLAETAAQCRRYFQLLGMGLTGNGRSTASALINGIFPVPMRATPTMTGLIANITLKGASSHTNSGGSWSFTDIDATGFLATINGWTDLIGGNGYALATSSCIAADSAI